MRISSAVLVVAVAAACAAPGAAASDRPLVVATHSVLGDLTANALGDDVRVELLVPAGADPHAVELSGARARLLRDADLVVANGLGLEAELADAIDAAEHDGVPVLHVAEHVDPLPFAAEDDHGEAHGGEHGDEHGDEPPGGHADPHDHGALDPHFWLDPLRAAAAVELIGATAAQVLPDAAGDVRGTAGRYAQRLRQLHAEVDDLLGTVPAERRRVVATHDALGYLSARYGLDVVGVVVPGGATLGEPSARDLARLVHDVEELAVDVVVAEWQLSSRLAELVADEAGARLVTVFTDALGPPGSGGATYVEMMRTNARRLAAALR